MPTSGVRLTGLVATERKMKDLAEVAGRAKAKTVMNQALRFAAHPAVKLAKAKAPVRQEGGNYIKRTYMGNIQAPGFLSRNIWRMAFTTREGTGVLRVGPTQEAFYGTQFLERGFYSRGPQPWLEPAFDAAKDEMVRRFGKKLEMLIDKQMKKAR